MIIRHCLQMQKEKEKRRESKEGEGELGDKISGEQVFFIEAFLSGENSATPVSRFLKVSSIKTSAN